MKYIGEHLLPGQLGHFFVVLALVSSLVATIAYAKATNAIDPNDERAWKKLARIAFGLDFFSVFAVFGLLYYIISSHLFEYFYAWNHSNLSLNTKYLLSCIWEGQEGSFLLWTCWHAVLGVILIFRAGKWEAPVLTVISFAQFCLATMILGLYIGSVKIGSNPFLLVRDMFQDAPVFARADYLSLPQMRDGQGLNQLLQNYWMVIHPPVLFMGFASTIVPFAYAIAGLWKKDFGGWTKQALPYTLFSGGVLGLGIMMGAAWAYESLTFGGFWAWDPVENASLVPWLVLVAGLHTQVVYNATGHSLRATNVFFILSFSLVLYSTFLTRSGVLGDSSVHAFTGEGMNAQLLIFQFIFLLPALALFGVRYKQIPHILKEEETSSREFWMFIGALVLFLSAAVITWQTSFNPIYNKITGKTTAAPEDVEFSYNKIQVFVAVVIAFLSAITQYLKYKKTSRDFWVKKILIPTILAAVVTLIFFWVSGIEYDKKGPGFLGALYLALFASIYSVVANAGYIWSGLNGKIKSAGASVAHVGFGLMLIGITISASNRKVLSVNSTGINLRWDERSKEKPMENLTLIKGVPTDMGKYTTTFLNSDSVNKTGNIIYYKIHMVAKDSSSEFDLYPNLIRNTKGQENFSNNPDSKHYWDKDIFSYISYADNMDRREDTAQFKNHLMRVNDTVFYSNGFIVLNKVVPNPVNDKYHFTPSDTALMADLTVFSKEGTSYKARPVFYVEDNLARFSLDTVYAQNLAVGFSKVMENQQIEIQVKESSRMVPFVALKVYEFPHINILWIGILIMVAGFVMSIFYRSRQGRLKAVVAENKN
ncbi:cytochrome c biogenesis protein CcsA [Flavihumibacter profundi]|jgi:cytochrome c-type biogenesis protein CcmF|uniref:cytochrome c biogenesis protein CcsA n=1 Tax=Flavihumibacter profundi TaxID=2716883 RepID=UPI001CC6CD11|nr:cytochrome c biogenesis protein CcsA [Flavihumibacter profundi]MBZ5855888.1 cytochrome c biogenesis protein CcsA [Flavihumibacter profundi]